MNFTVKSERGNLYKLYLKKDNTYKYVFSSLSIDEQTILDSGTYELKDKAISFTSKYTSKYINDDNFSSNKTYFLKEVKLKSYQSINTSGNIYCKRKKVFITKITFLLKNDNDSILINSKKPLDNVNMEVLSPDTLIKQWIVNNVLPLYHYNTNDLDSSNWVKIFDSKTLDILAVTNKPDLFGIYFSLNGIVYYTNYQRSVEYQIALVDKFHKEKNISLSQKKEIEKLIKDLFKK